MRSLLLAVCLPVLLSHTLSAQQILLAEHKGRAYPVLRASRERPLVREDNKFVVPSGTKLGFKKTDEYLPAFISVQNVRVRNTSMRFVNDDRDLNHRFEFKADFVSPYALEDVFVVLELFFERGSPSLFIYEIGRLEPRRHRSLDLGVPVGIPLGDGKYQVHLFVGGHETMHSLQPFNYREQVLDRMIAKRTAALPDGKPQFFIGPLPEHPKSMRKSRTKGHATIRARIRTTGAVIDPEIVDASDPAFGESALTAVRQWRFLPMIKNGRPVETVAELPIDFDVPDQTHEDS